MKTRNWDAILTGIILLAACLLVVDSVVLATVVPHNQVVMEMLVAIWLTQWVTA